MTDNNAPAYDAAIQTGSSATAPQCHDCTAPGPALSSRWRQDGLAVCSGLLLALPFLETQLYVLAWFAWVPLLFGIDLAGASRARQYRLGLITGLVFYVIASHWITDFLQLAKDLSLPISILLGSVYWILSAHLFALVVLLFHWLRNTRGNSECWIFPVITVAVFSAIPQIFQVKFGESQSAFLVAIQATEFVGVYGLDLIIALSNMLIYLCLAPFILPQTQIVKIRKFNPVLRQVNLVGAGILILVWFAYGIIATQHWSILIAQSPSLKVGILQPDEPASLKALPVYPGYTRAYAPEMEMSERLAQAGAELIVWPEARYKGYFDKPELSQAFHARIAGMQAHVMLQDVARSGVSNHSQTRTEQNSSNAIAMINDRGELTGTYTKMRRIAFGEYLPWVSDTPWLKALAVKFWGDFLDEMTPGTQHQVFQLGALQVVPLVCYETTFSRFVAQSAAHANSSAILIALSSDGWFGPSYLPYQHVSTSILRAVENRMPLVHALNNGPSMAVAANGQVLFSAPPQQAGGYLVDVPYQVDANRSLYSRYPSLLTSVIYLLFSLMVISACLNKNRN